MEAGRGEVGEDNPGLISSSLASHP